MCKIRKEIVAGRGFYFMPSSMTVIKVTVREKYIHQKMVDAIEKLEKTHPIINNIVVQKQGKLWFEDIGIHLSVIRYTDNEMTDWQKIADNILLKFYDLSKEPGVTIAVLEHKECFDVLTAVHHIYGDGVSLKYIMSDLLYIYSTGNTISPRTALTELSEKHLTSQIHISEELNKKINEIIEKCNETKPAFDYEMFHKMKMLDNKLVRYEFVFGNIDGLEYYKLKQMCKMYNITINSAIMTALVSVIQSEEGIHAIIPVNTRPLLGYSEDKGLANFASSIRPFFKYQQEISFWDNAVAFHEIIQAFRNDVNKLLENLYSFMKLNENIFGMSYFAQYGMFKDLDLVMKLQDILGIDIRKKNVDFSNIGEMFIDGADENMIFSDCYSMSNHVPACECVVTAVSMNGDLTLSLGYSLRHISPDSAKNIMNTVIDKLLQ